MRITALILLICLLTGCATGQNYTVYVEAQRSLSRDATVLEAGRISALVEIAKTHPDAEVRLAAIRALVQLGERSRPVTIDIPRHPLFAF